MITLEESDVDLDAEEKRLLKKLERVREIKRMKAKYDDEDDFDTASYDVPNSYNTMRDQRDNVFINDIEDVILNPNPKNIVKSLIRIKRNPSCDESDLLKGVVIGGIGGYILRDIIDRYR